MSSGSDSSATPPFATPFAMTAQALVLALALAGALDLALIIALTIAVFPQISLYMASIYPATPRRHYKGTIKANYSPALLCISALSIQHCSSACSCRSSPC